MSNHRDQLYQEFYGNFGRLLEAVAAELPPEQGIKLYNARLSMYHTLTDALPETFGPKCDHCGKRSRHTTFRDLDLRAPEKIVELCTACAEEFDTLVATGAVDIIN